jgi:hypothetical protein
MIAPALELRITIGARGVTHEYVPIVNPEPERLWDTRTGRLEDWSWGDPVPDYPEPEPLPEPVGPLAGIAKFHKPKGAAPAPVSSGIARFHHAKK